jgi:two-component system, chemotaxis family, protein-glutamate methylesterase/glutaminase
MSPTRVLVVDDSAFARKVLREVLQTSATLEVVGTARDGLDALSKIQELDPDVVTLDLAMPYLDGLETLRALAGRPRPRVVVVSMAGPHSDAALDALAMGAVDIVHKPTALATDQLYEVAKELVYKVEAAAAARTVSFPPPSAPPVVTASHGRYDIVLIGASTGGPQAIARIIKELPADFPVPVAVVVHLPAGFTEGYAQRLNEDSALRVVEATDGIRLQTGHVVIAQGGSHLTVHRDSAGLFGIVSDQPHSLHRPSVDVLFHSAASVTAGRTLAVVLTGMGDDGLLGSRTLRAQGADILVEAEQSCVVYGMPRVIWEAALANEQHQLPQMAAAILQRV